MEGKISSGLLWNEAGKAGLALGLVSTVYMFLNLLLSGGGAGFLGGILSFLLWLGKLVLCIWLMGFFMKRLVARYPEADNAATFRFGTRTALLSSLLFSAASLANVLFISKDAMMEQWEAAISSYSSMLDSNSMEMLDRMQANLPQITFISNFIYCFLFGTILALILSRNIPAKDPFADNQ